MKARNASDQFDVHLENAECQWLEDWMLEAVLSCEQMLLCGSTTQHFVTISLLSCFLLILSFVVWSSSNIFPWGMLSLRLRRCWRESSVSVTCLGHRAQQHSSVRATTHATVVQRHRKVLERGRWWARCARPVPVKEGGAERATGHCGLAARTCTAAGATRSESGE